MSFLALVSHATPLLKQALKQEEKAPGGIIFPQPDYFPHQKKANLKEYIKDYKRNLSAHVFLSSFSFFEAYVSSAINEVFDFHGGAEAMVIAANDRCVNSIHCSDPVMIKSKKKLQDAFDQGKKQKYKKHIMLLKGKDFRFPSDLLTPYGILRLSELVSRMRAVQIPEVLCFGLHLRMSQNEKSQFHGIRDMRNKIAHGEPCSPNLDNAFEANRFLSNLAIKVDAHIVHNFLIIEKF